MYELKWGNTQYIIIQEEKLKLKINLEKTVILLSLSLLCDILLKLVDDL
jgi:hypothetical protein